MEQAALTFANVSKVYDGAGSAERYALRDVSFDIASGKTVAIVGRSGSGKSTLLHLAAGIDVPTRGSVSVRGTPLEGLNETARTRLRRSEIGFVFQLFHLLPHLTVRDNVALPELIAGARERTYRERVAALLERVGLPDRAGRSGGRAQRRRDAAGGHLPGLAAAAPPVARGRAHRKPGRRQRPGGDGSHAADGGGGGGDADLCHPQPRAGGHGRRNPAAPQRDPGRGIGRGPRVMLRYFYRTVSAHWRTNPVLYGLTVLGVALGVASVISIRILNQSAIASFAAGVRTMGGVADVVVTGKGGTLPDEFFPRVRGTPGVAAAWPVFETTVAVEGKPETFVRLLGVDLLAPAQDFWEALSGLPPRAETGVAVRGRGWVAVTPELATEMGWKVGDRFGVRGGAGARTLRVGAFIDFQRWGTSGGRRALVTDIAEAQSLFGGAGTLHRIGVKAAEGVDLAALAARIEDGLGGRVDAVTPSERTGQAQQLLGAFRLNLTALSMVSLLVGTFLVFSSMRACLVWQRREFGVLRSLGSTPAQVLALILGEAALLGVMGVIIGIFAGYWTAIWNLDAVSSTLTNVYMLQEIESLEVSGGTLALAVFAGLGGALSGTLLPALDVWRQGHTHAAGHLPDAVHGNRRRPQSLPSRPRAGGRRLGLVLAAGLALAAVGFHPCHRHDAVPAAARPVAGAAPDRVGCGCRTSVSATASGASARPWPTPRSRYRPWPWPCACWWASRSWWRASARPWCAGWTARCGADVYVTATVAARPGPGATLSAPLVERLAGRAQGERRRSPAPSVPARGRPARGGGGGGPEPSGGATAPGAAVGRRCRGARGP